MGVHAQWDVLHTAHSAVTHFMCEKNEKKNMHLHHTLSNLNVDKKSSNMDTNMDTITSCMV